MRAIEPRKHGNTVNGPLLRSISPKRTGDDDSLEKLLKATRESIGKYDSDSTNKKIKTKDSMSTAQLLDYSPRKETRRIWSLKEQERNEIERDAARRKDRQFEIKIHRTRRPSSFDRGNNPTSNRSGGQGNENQLQQRRPRRRDELERTLQVANVLPRLNGLRLGGAARGIFKKENTGQSGEIGASFALADVAGGEVVGIQVGEESSSMAFVAVRSKDTLSSASPLLTPHYGAGYSASGAYRMLHSSA